MEGNSMFSQNRFPAPSPAPAPASVSDDQHFDDQHSDIASELEEVTSNADDASSIVTRKSTASSSAPVPAKVVKKDRPFRIRPCQSIEDNAKCPHGKKCCFAHSVEELRISPCKFDAKCKNKNRLCEFSHGSETAQDVATRCGWFRVIPSQVSATHHHHQIPHNPSQSHTPPQAPPSLPPYHPHFQQSLYAHPATVVNQQYIPRQTSKFAQFMSSPLQPQQPPPPPPPPQMSSQFFSHFEAPTEETVIRVPKELAEMAMRLALEKGKTNLRVEII